MRSGGVAGSVALRTAGPEDCRLLWELRNDPQTRASSFKTDSIPYEEHQRWFEAQLGSPDLKIFVVEEPSGRSIGYVRFHRSGSEAEVSVALDPAQRGKGYGPSALRAASEQLLSEGWVKRVTALIKQSNPPSRAAFERAGFRLGGTRRVGSEEVWEMLLP